MERQHCGPKSGGGDEKLQFLLYLGETPNRYANSPEAPKLKVGGACEVSDMFRESKRELSCVTPRSRTLIDKMG